MGTTDVIAEIGAREEHYHLLFSEMDEGFALVEMIYDDRGLPADYYFVDMNPAGLQMAGLRREEVVGRTGREIDPNLDDSWVEAFGRVGQTGHAARFRSYAGYEDRWYEVYAYSAGEHLVAVLYQDITEQKRAEAELGRQREQLQAQADDLRAAAEELDQRVQERTAELMAEREQTRIYARRLVEEVENERRNIARELHDEAGQALTAILIELGSIEAEARRSAVHLVEPVAELKRKTDEVMDGLHRLSRNLRPASLDRLGLVAALRQHIQSFEQQNRIDVDFMPVHFDNGRLPDQIETAVYRVVQEALTNVARHATASHVGVVVKRKGQRVLAIVEDDGRGFDLNQARERGRLGLLGMRERAECLGGRLEVESAIGRGTTIFLDIPVAANNGCHAGKGA